MVCLPRNEAAWAIVKSKKRSGLFEEEIVAFFIKLCGTSTDARTRKTYCSIDVIYF